MSAEVVHFKLHTYSTLTGIYQQPTKVSVQCMPTSNADSVSILYIQVNKKFCELKRGNIGIVEKAQETRFGMSPKYSRYIGIAS